MPDPTTSPPQQDQAAGVAVLARPAQWPPYELRNDGGVGEHATGKWVLFRIHDDGSEEVVRAIGLRPGEHRRAQAKATRAMYRQEVRVVGWTRVRENELRFLPVIATPARAAWDVTDLAPASGPVFQLSGGRWYAQVDGDDAGADRAYTRDELEACYGTLHPVAVSSIPALVAEVEMFRATAVYVSGAEDCLEGDCEHVPVEPADNPAGNPLDALWPFGRPTGPCPLLQEHIATAAEACALIRVKAILKRIRTDAERTMATDRTMSTAAERAEAEITLDVAGQLEHAIREELDS